MMTTLGDGQWKCASRRRCLIAGLIVAVSLLARHAKADEPYARSRDYDLQHSKIALRFDLEQKKVIGDVTHTISVLKDGTEKIWFDSVGLTIQSVTVNKTAAKFESKETRLIVPLPAAAKNGTKYD